MTALVAGVYDGSAQLAYHAAVVAGTACPVWPGTAVALIAMIRYGRRAAPGILLGIILANTSRGLPTLAVALIVAANMTEPVVSVALLRHRHIDTRLATTPSILGFLGAVGSGALVSAAGGVGALWITGVIGAAAVPSTAALWWLGNICGVLCIAPLALVGPARGYASRAEELLVAGCALGVGTVVLATGGAQVYALFPILIWAGLRLGSRGAAGVTLVLSALTVVYAARGEGPFVQSTPTASLLTAQGFILVTALSTLLLAAITTDRRRAGLRLIRSEHAKRELADEQAALRRVAEAAAGSLEAEPTLDLATREIAHLLDADFAAVVKYVDPDRVLVCGEWGRMARAEARLTEMCIAPGGVADRVRSGETARHDERGGPLSLPPFVERVGSPIMVEDEPWGAVIVGTSRPVAMPHDTEERLERFAGLVALAVANSQSRARLTAQARTDPLTGLLNHRAFHERLQEEIARARRHDRALSVAVFDVDHFKSVNDSLGHAAGDSVLVEAAHRLCHVSRRDESVGRLGGDELAVIMPEVEGPAAEAAADRMRQAIVGDYPGIGQITASAGTCDLAHGGDVHGLMRCADRALYRAKARGRDAVFLYTPGTGEELDAEDRAERLARSQALSGVRALARAIDAKDPTTTLHSERVADLVRHLAQTAGWAPDRVALLHEAALVHDVGKIGVPDAILFKRGRLDALEAEQVRRHAELGAQIANEVLGVEQVAWIRSHHERHDGRGYPHGLSGTEIPEGASLLAIADAWDAMTHGRFYSSRIAPDEAWDECVRESGRQFNPAAVAILARLRASGRLPGGDESDAADDRAPAIVAGDRSAAR